MLGRVRCPKCGKGVLRERMYCPHCNANLHTNYWPVGVQQKGPENVRMETKPSSLKSPGHVEPKKNGSVIISIFVAIMVIGVFILAAFFLVSSPPIKDLLFDRSVTISVRVINDRPYMADVEVDVMCWLSHETDSATLLSGQWAVFGSYEYTFDKDSSAVKDDLPIFFSISCFDSGANDTTSMGYMAELGKDYHVTLYLSDWSWSISS